MRLKVSANWGCQIDGLESLIVKTFSFKTVLIVFVLFELSVSFVLFGACFPPPLLDFLSPTLFGFLLSCTCASFATVSMDFPVNALAHVSDITQVAKLWGVNSCVYLEVLEKCPVVLTTIGSMVGLL